MEKTNDLHALIAAAQADAKIHEARLNAAATSQGAKAHAQDQEMRAATAGLEKAAVDLFGLFEARMQHHFKRGPFSRKLRAALLAAKQPDLADRIHKYYLAVNVLKHGTGASYRELLAAKATPFGVLAVADVVEDETRTTSGLIDVSTHGFIDGLAGALLEAQTFLESNA
ncbi:hypothetical protein SAMN04488005_2024 [Yoonia tamlensis]|uniref:Uncharacterized protein n=1 Tax=Yoonia tamlensis TaxID=390270 RepID=A0A1I6GQC8_9RHOB|nr:hypothetical protein [Yoonia tamlensis]SFR44380.1 hypothetical protein SAMN04488005_2024 [Yoonia tamlensis]